jgi:membrane protein required for colicin V production
VGLAGVTQFDIIVFILLLISAGVGFARGAVREIVALVSLVAAAFAAIFGLPMSTPIAHRFIHSGWLGAAAALAVVFLVTYLLLRLIGGAIARQVQETAFVGVLDRSVGLFIGLARGLIVLGALNLMFNAATPKDLQPHWIIGSTTWPLAQDMGRLLTGLAPKGLDIADRLKPAFKRAVDDSLGDRSTTEGYDARERGAIDELVEKSR